MAEFAIASGISRPTVSKYFNDPNSVRKSTRAQIEEALGRFDYQPNIYAVNQNRQMTILIHCLSFTIFAPSKNFVEKYCFYLGLYCFLKPISDLVIVFANHFFLFPREHLWHVKIGIY